MQIEGNTFLISGGGSGLGNACALRFLRMGANVVLIDIAAPLESVMASTPGRYVFAKADVTKENEVRGAIDEGVRAFGPPSAAVICAGILHSERTLGRDGPASLERFRRVIEVNLVGTFNFLRLSADAISKKSMAFGT